MEDANNVTDEFIDPTIIDSNDNGHNRRSDVVIFFNFRTDRGRELTEVLPKWTCMKNMHKLSLYYVTLTNYDETYKIKSLQQRQHYGNFSEVLEKQTKLKLELQKRSILTLLFSFRWTRRAFHW
jgi:2,3-bisphosphoglycerate-independent phosphoglycerate mutase